MAPAASPKPQLDAQQCFDASLETLVKQRENPSTAELLRWLEVVSHGGDIECENKRWRLEPGVRSQLTIRLDPIFAFNHPNVARAIRSSIVASSGKWTASGGASSLNVKHKADVLTMLLQVRRAIAL